MEPLPPANPRGTRLALVALGLFGLLAVVAFASRAGLGGGSQAAPSQTYLDYAFSVFFVVFVLAIPFVIYAYWLQQRENAEAGKLSRRPFWQTISIIATFTAITLILRQLHKFHVQNPFQNAQGTTDRIKNGKGNAGKAVAVEPHFRWPVLVAFVVLILALVVVALVLHRRRRKRVYEALSQPEVKLELARAISDAIDDLEAEPDARKAVIAAYARMEGVLARHGLPRRPSETPFEYLGRVLTELRARADHVGRLTTLFERAKFSRHEIDTAMKGEAIAALGSIRDDLEAAALA